jgi:presenilin-like A22 family membrane protease
MSAKKPARLYPVYWGILLFVIAQILTLLVVSRIDPFLTDNNIYVPNQPPQAVSWWPGQVTLPSGEITETPAYSSLGPILIYIFAVVAVLGLVLSLIPLSALRFVLRLLFAFLFCWGVFIALVFYLPLMFAIVIAAGVGIAWFLIPLVWLHDLALILAVVSLGAVFGRFTTPWTAMVLMLVLAIYDFLAVRFGFMIWMTGKLSQTNALPALIIPKNYSGWSSSLRQPSATDLVGAKSTDRKYSILGGGDITFPCLLTASVYFAQGLASGVIIAVSGFLGLISAYSIQATFLKGKPMPALPPIAAIALVGLLVIW